MRSILLGLVAFAFAQAHAALSISLQAYNDNCGNGTGSVTVGVSGGVPPYTYAWSTGSTDFQITGLSAGAYWVTVTDGALTQLSDTVTITNSPVLEVFPDAIFMGLVQVSNAGNHACPGQCNGGFGLPNNYFPSAVLPLNFFPAPYYSDPGPLGGASFTGYCEGANPVVTITDATGCANTYSFSPVPEVVMQPVVVTSIDPSCINTGTITVDVGANCWCDLQLMDSNYVAIGNVVSTWSGTYTYSGLAPGDYHISRANWQAYGGCPETYDVTVPDLGPDCGVVGGTIFLDHDQDCVQDPGDEGMPYRVLTIMPGPGYAITDGTGTYVRGLPYGSYTVAQPLVQVQQLCPGAVNVPFVLQNGAPNATVNFADSSLIPLDLEVGLASTAARPGFTITYYLNVANHSGQLSAGLASGFLFDPSLTFLNSFPAPTTSGAGSLTWTGGAGLGAFGTRQYVVQLQVPTGAVLGSLLNASFSVYQPFQESNTGNNAAAISTTVTGSYDPNDKLARTSTTISSTDYNINADDYIDYTIRFQNTGTDTAFTVVVADTIAEELDLSSFEQGLASHPFTVQFKSGRMVEWTFSNILLPDSNTNEAASHGLVKFRIGPVLPLFPGTVLENAADIYFDFNAPVRTPPSVLMATTGMDVAAANATELQLFPQPAEDRLHVRWNGTAPSTDYQLLQTDGRLVRTGRTGAEGIDMGGLSTGSYVLALRAPGGWVHARVIKE